MDLVEEVKRALDAEFRPDGYNVGFNAGVAAGQTVMHLHVHVIPRYADDMEDPRGGVRHVVPWKGNYRAERSRALSTGGRQDPFYEHVLPLFPKSKEVAILAAFVQDSGLKRIEAPVRDALGRGARVRVLTGDYLDITQADALQRLLDWVHEFAAGKDDGLVGCFEARVVEVARIGDRVTSFHPKSWRFEGPEGGVAFVGSSNLSESALVTGIEWNLRADRRLDPLAYEAIAKGFEDWWARAGVLTEDWVGQYRLRARARVGGLPPGEEFREPVAAPPTPHAVQREALASLEAARDEGRRRALVVLATGLGKTLLAGFDVLAVGRKLDRVPRVLFLAHRAELLRQAAEAFRRLLPDARFGWFVGQEDTLEADVVFASVQKLKNQPNLDRLAKLTFDYVVVDEVHHAAAQSYRAILGQLSPGFLLGLTATPDRTDQADILGLFDDHLAYQAGLDVGIHQKMLVPFEYHGLKDTTDYANIPWRNHQFDPAELASAVQTVARMERLWEGWQDHPAARTLVFCVSIEHARFVREWLQGKGVKAEAVFSAPDSLGCADALGRLTRGEIQALCAVDLLNEGIDLPALDRVVMLRPTESPVLFMQQLGRGLRVHEGKGSLTVLDFVGNHRVFLDRVRTLLSLGAHPTPLARFVRDGAPADLPPGCSVDIELEAINLLQHFLRTGGPSELIVRYRELRSVRDRRPLAVELYQRDLNLGSLRKSGGWFELVRAEGDLEDGEAAVLDAAGEWFRDLQVTQMTKCFKMVTLEVLLEAGAFTKGMPLDELARRCHDYLARSPELFRDIEGVRELPTPARPDEAAWGRYWRENPVAAWIGESGPTLKRSWFRLANGRLEPTFTFPAEFEATAAEMTRELVAYRLAQYRRRRETELSPSAFDAKVTWNKRDPIIKLPSSSTRPSGDLSVRLPDGAVWRFRFMKEYCNVAHRPGEPMNSLPDLLRRWFGPGAGRPGTDFHVRFSRRGDDWYVEPLGQMVAFPVRGSLTAYASLEAAAGPRKPGGTGYFPAEDVKLPGAFDGEKTFAVRADGDSMHGGADPIQDGDWVVMEWARDRPLGSIVGRVALLLVDEPATAFLLKRVQRKGDGFVLASDNPRYAPVPAAATTVPIALLVRAIRPEQLAPAPGTRIWEADLAREFAVSHAPRSLVERVDGHLFLCVEAPGPFADEGTLDLPVSDRRPGETAFVLTRTATNRPWRYAGVARWRDRAWRLPPVDPETWAALGRPATTPEATP